MPWHVERGRQDCAGFAVVKDDTDELVSCHRDREEAAAHVRALYANEPEARVAALDGVPEVRSAQFQPVDIADDGSSFDGYAAVFDEIAEFDIPGVGTVREEVRRGAFRKALASGENVPMLYHHLDMHPPLATTGGGTLKLEEDAKGLRVQAQIARGYIGDAVRELVRRGDIPGMSWGFVTGRGNSKISREGGMVRRTLTGFQKIIDVSPTWDPTYRGTVAEVRSRTFGVAFPVVQSGEITYEAEPHELVGVAPDHDEADDAENAETRDAGHGGSGATPRLAAAKRRLQIELANWEGGADDGAP